MLGQSISSDCWPSSARPTAATGSKGPVFPRRSVAAGVALAAIPYVAVVAARHPWWPSGGLGALYFWPLLAVGMLLAAGLGGGALYLRAATVDDGPA